MYAHTEGATSERAPETKLPARNRANRTIDSGRSVFQTLRVIVAFAVVVLLSLLLLLLLILIVSSPSPSPSPSSPYDLSSLLFASLPSPFHHFILLSSSSFFSSSSSLCGFSRSTGRPVDWLLKGACLLAYNNERTRNYLSTRRKRIVLVVRVWPGRPLRGTLADKFARVIGRARSAPLFSLSFSLRVSVSSQRFEG